MVCFSSWACAGVAHEGRAPLPAPAFVPQPRHARALRSSLGPGGRAHRAWVRHLPPSQGTRRPPTCGSSNQMVWGLSAEP